MIRKVLIKQIIEMVEILDSLATTAHNKPTTPLLFRGASEKETQHILELLHYLPPRNEIGPAYDKMCVRRVGPYSMKSPTALSADVIASDDKHFLNESIKDDLLLSRIGIVFVSFFRIRWLISLSPFGVSPSMPRTP